MSRSTTGRKLNKLGRNFKICSFSYPLIPTLVSKFVFQDATTPFILESITFRIQAPEIGYVMVVVQL